PRTMQPRHFVPGASVAAGGLSLAAALLDSRALFVALPLAAAYAIGVLWASFRTGRRLGRERLPSLLVVFPVLHFAYGTGFLLGLVRFLPRWWRPDPPPPALAPR
ncbi:MAG: hypothetical protein ACREQQ_07365, partial [Candidatus Binatia bacterium]